LKGLSFRVISTILAISISLILLEVLLRIYNPFFFSIRGSNFVPPTNTKYIYENIKISGVSDEITISKNSLGFRGEEPPINFDEYFTILAVGGSTTESVYNSDGGDWPNLVSDNLKQKFSNIWVNNAGFNGHSTFAHLLVMRDSVVKIKPKLVLFLIGVNDIGDSWSVNGTAGLRDWDKKYFNYNQTPKDSLSLEDFFWDMGEYSEVSALLASYIKRNKAISKGLITEEFGDVGHRDYIPKKILDLEDSYIERSIAWHKENYIPDYSKRIEKLISISKNNNITPIFITQPALYGNLIDPTSGVNLAKMKINDGVNGELAWKILQLYNSITKKIGNQNNIFVIDLASEMPKDSKYYYDPIHYTDLGSKEISNVISRHLINYLSSNFLINEH
jgi:lysophospholipase L1-like esterase